FRHVPGELNSTDLLSRGSSPRLFSDSLWWEGPSWLLEPPSNWPIDRLACETSEVERERRKVRLCNLVVVEGEIPCRLVGEVIVRVLKKLLRRTLGNAVLTTEELQTVLCDCESVINSRPLSYLSENSDDLVPLCPAMFLAENRNLDVPDIDYRAKVIRLIPGKDGKIRTVELITRTGTMLGPIQRVYPSEVETTETPNNPLNDCTFTNPISSISSDMLSDPNASSSVLPRVSMYGRVINAPEKLDLFNQALYVFESK
ncbi:putative RNA-directed DNA polymerase from transposon X-element, partial [Trichonephila inaurata madagascariensis]